MPTRSRFFDDDVFPAFVTRGLIGPTVWDSGEIGYHLEAGDFDGNGVNDWDEDGARAAIELAFETWAAVADINFFATTRSQATLVERISDADSDPDGDSVTLGFHYLPGGNGGGGLRDGEQSDGEYNQDAFAWNVLGLAQGGSAFSTIVHEIGHALGLEHPFDDDLFLGSTGEGFGEFGTYGLNQNIYTIMSYNGGWVGNGGESSSPGYGHSGTPMALDIAAIQAVYGANTSHATGDDVYTLSRSNNAGTFYSTIWDAGGTDTIAYDGFQNVTIFLDEATIDDSPTGGGLLSYIDNVLGGYTVARGTVIENARTDIGADVIGGNAAANLIESGGGNDFVMGLDGGDTLVGGDGDDVLIGDYRSVAEFGVPVLVSPFEGPTLPGGLSVGSGAATAGPSTNNTSRGAALDVSGGFALGSDPDVLDGDAFYTVDVGAVSGGGFAYYRFTLTEEATVTLDIDDGYQGGAGGGSFDPYLTLEDQAGNTVAFNDDLVSSDAGSVGTSTGRNIDSYIRVALDPGTYYVQVGQYDPSGSIGLNAGASYTLSVSADGAVLRDPPVLPQSGIEQFGYYYETPDLSPILRGYVGGGDAAGAQGAKAGGGDHDDHDHGGEGVHTLADARDAFFAGLTDEAPDADAAGASGADLWALG